MRLEFRNISSPASCPLMPFCPHLKKPNYYQLYGSASLVKIAIDIVIVVVIGW
jgi:hypothetical protein